jgi:hypothetical protein
VYRQDLGVPSLKNQLSCICKGGRVAGQSVHLKIRGEYP